MVVVWLINGQVATQKWHLAVIVRVILFISGQFPRMCTLLYLSCMKAWNSSHYGAFSSYLIHYFIFLLVYSPSLNNSFICYSVTLCYFRKSYEIYCLWLIYDFYLDSQHLSYVLVICYSVLYSECPWKTYSMHVLWLKHIFFIIWKYIYTYNTYNTYNRFSERIKY